MAEAKQADDKRSIELSKLDRSWIIQCINTQRSALVRSRNKEMSESEIHGLRTKEIEYLNQLLNKFA